ncbi:MAG: hypothetical protein K2Z81_12985 [Cyanobacteria bacterium]|nr:hypothetical protein [Cyanobacteriota bacterium]
MSIDFSAKTRDLLKRHITSVWQLELLLFFKHSSTSLSVEDAARARYLDTKVVEPVINTFVTNGFLARDHNNRFFYSNLCTFSEEIEEVARVYKERPHSVIKFMFSSPIRSFSDAFNLRAKEEE